VTLFPFISLVTVVS